jgi:hypothetical protein
MQYWCNLSTLWLDKDLQTILNILPPTQHWNVSLGDKMCSAQRFCLLRKESTWQWQKSTRSAWRRLITIFHIFIAFSVLFSYISGRCYCMVNECTFFVLTTILPGTSGQSSWSWYTLIGFVIRMIRNIDLGLDNSWYNAQPNC